MTILIFFLLLFAVGLATPVLWPHIDITVAQYFYNPDQGFFLADNRIFDALHTGAFIGPRMLGILFALLAITSILRKLPLLGIDSKGWLFLLWALILGPGLIANIGFKDHWGRARPHEVTQFGGVEEFTPALEPHFDRAKRNGSFVCGDGAFGFYLTAFGFVVPRRRSRREFWSGIAAGFIFSFDRIAMGGHFLSDCIYAGFFMLLANIGLYAAMYGKGAAKQRWQDFFSPSVPAAAP